MHFARLILMQSALGLLTATSVFASPVKSNNCNEALIGPLPRLASGLQGSPIAKHLGPAFTAAQSGVYRVEESTPSPVSKAIEIKLHDVAMQLLENAKDLETAGKAKLSPDDQALVTAKLALAGEAAELLALGAQRYTGTDAGLILGRDAFARQLETAVKLTAPSSSGRLPEVTEHREFVRAILAAKKSNPSLSEAEATVRGVEVAYRAAFVRRCADGSCKVPGEDILKAGARTRLQEIKDCI